MSGHLDINTMLDTEYGERITLERSELQDTARLSLFVNPDGLGYADAVMTYLTPLQLRALAALCLITAEEMSR